MKRNAILSVLLIQLLFLPFGASSEQRAGFIGGTIANVGEAKLTINAEEVMIDRSGRFEHRIVLERPAYVLFKLESLVVFFVEPGDSLEIEIDARHFFDSFKIRGSCREVNELMLHDAKEADKLHKFFGQHYQQIYRMGEEDFISLVDSLKTSFTNRLESFLETREDPNDYFARTKRAMIHYSWANGLLEYPDRHRDVTGKRDFEPSDAYYDFSKSIDFNNPELLNIPEYAHFLKNYVAVRAEEVLEENAALQEENYREFRAKLRVAMQTFTDPHVKDEMLYSIVLPLLDEYSIKGIDDLMELFRTNCTKEEYIEKIEELYNNDKEIQRQCEIRTYKTANGVALDAFVYWSEGIKPGDKRSALAFFHGGGWYLGKPEWGHWQCEHFSSLGLVCISFEYRVNAQHNNTPVECIADAKSAIRWMRSNAIEFGIDPNRIVASGFSAGGHIATCTVVIDAFDEPGEDHTISSAADALILWSAAVKIFNGNGWFHRLLRGKATVVECDPAQHVRPGLPPSIIFQGTLDDQVPAWSTKKFSEDMKEAGNRCDLHLYEGQTHLGWGKNSDDVFEKMEAFLVSIGFLHNE